MLRKNSRKRTADKAKSPPAQREEAAENAENGQSKGFGLCRGADGQFGAICQLRECHRQAELDNAGNNGEEEEAKMGGAVEMMALFSGENAGGEAGGIVQMLLASPEAAFSLSWRVEWSGTFPVSKISAENVAKRLDALLPSSNGPTNAGQKPAADLQPKRRLAGTKALLQICPDEVTASALDNPKLQFLSHAIRKVCCVFGRVQTRQLAYITREQPSHCGHHIPYRKQCHVFLTETPFEVEEIESVLSAAFQRALSKDGTAQVQIMNSPSPKLRLPSANVRDVATSPPLFADSNQPSPMKTPKKEKAGFLERSRSQMRISSSSLIQKIFGTPKKQPLAKSSPEFQKPSLPAGGIAVRLRKPRWPLTPLRSCASTTAFYSTPKRPAPPPASNKSTTMVHPKRTSSNAAANHQQQSSQCQQFDGAHQRFSSSSTQSPPNKQNCLAYDGFLVPSLKKKPFYGHEERRNESPSELVYDERLKEWIYPLDEFMVEDLERLAYFCRPNEKEFVLEQLRRMPLGHFVLRLSGSRRKCLALTIRVEQDEANPKGVAHYLVVRNEHGYRIRGSKRYFASLPMLVTHHSVLAEQLPCRLQLSDWRWTREPLATRRRQSSGGSTLAALRARDECGVEVPELPMVRWRRPVPGMNAAAAGTMANGNQAAKPQSNRLEPQQARLTSSTRFSSKSSTVLSA